MSLYADDLAQFIRPSPQNLSFVKTAFDIFGEAFGLRINYSKSNKILIRQNELDKQRVKVKLQCKIGCFPCRYLGLQLGINYIAD